jgi:hypothetical protein
VKATSVGVPVISIPKELVAVELPLPLTPFVLIAITVATVDELRGIEVVSIAGTDFKGLVKAVAFDTGAVDLAGQSVTSAAHEVIVSVVVELSVSVLVNPVFIAMVTVVVLVFVAPTEEDGDAAFW